MAWNEPGNNNGRDKDPWGNKDSGGKKEQGPPDLDEVFNKLSQKLGGKFGGGGKKGGSGSPFNGGGAIGLGVVAAVAVAVWFFSGFYTIGEAEKGVVLRLGKQQEALVDPGLNWNPTWIDTVTPINMEAIRSLKSSGLMLTKDENVVTVEMGVQYRVSDPIKYLFSVTNADDSLRQATDSALRAVIGDAVMDDILTSGRQVIRERTQDTINRIIEKYNLGLTVVDVNFQSARPPEAVKSSFDDAISAREDEERFIREAEAYSNDILPKATGRAERLKKEALGYSERTVNGAIGQVAQFEKLLPEFKAAPEVTRTRMYLDTMQNVYSKTSKVLIDSESNGNLLYLPLDRMMNQSADKVSTTKDASADYDYGIELEKTTNDTQDANNGRSTTRQGRY